MAGMAGTADDGRTRQASAGGRAGRDRARAAALAVTVLIALTTLGCGASDATTDAAGSPQATQSTATPSVGPATSTPPTPPPQRPGAGTASTVDATKATPSSGERSTTTAPRGASTSAASGAADGTGWQVVGTSVRGRPLRVTRVGTGPRHVLWIGGIHGNEPEGMTATAQLPDAFTQARLGATVTLTILEDANPDGRAANTRGNANGVDVNRNFPATNFDAKNPEFGGAPLSQPEAKVVDSLLTSEKPDLVIVMHSWADKQFINFDGPAQAIAAQFSKQSGMPVEASNTIAVTPGSLGSYFGVTQGKPILTVEFARGLDKGKAWAMIHDAALTAIRG